MFSARVREEEEDILLDNRDLPPQRREIPVAHVDAVDQHAAHVGIVGAVDELGDGAFPRARLAHNGNGFARFHLERNVAQDLGSGHIAEGNVLEGNAAQDVVAEAAAVLIQVIFGVDQFQDAPRAGHAA